MPPYCLAETEKIRMSMKVYIRENRDRYLSVLKDSTDITWLATRKAKDYATKFPVGCMHACGCSFRG